MKMLSYGERATPLISPKVDRSTIANKKTRIFFNSSKLNFDAAPNR
jgi:hypothetical protein